MERLPGIISLTAALHCEAKPFIDHYGLRKNNDIKYFDVYEGEGISMVVSGVGKLQSAAATAVILSRRSFTAAVNIGLCGALSPRYAVGTPILVHQVVDVETGIQYLPDVLINHSMEEGSLETHSRPVTHPDAEKIRTDLVDMEGAGFFSAASRFLSPHQIYVIKIVSDHLENVRFSKEYAAHCVEKAMEPVVNLLEQIRRFCPQAEELLTPGEKETVAALKQHLRLTATQRHQLDEIVRRYKIRTGSPLPGMDEIMEMRVRVKDERQKAFGIVQRILSTS